MENEVLNEVRQLRDVIAKLIGTAALPTNEQFSKEAIEKAAKQFHKFKIERGQWVSDWDLHKIFKDANRVGPFIRLHFGFSNYFKRGHSYYYNRNDLITLSKELKARNVDLGRYIDYIEDKEKFKKCLERAKENKGRKKSFQLPYDLRDVNSTPPQAPSPEVIREDIERLKQEFFQYKLADYVDIYKGNYAMMKFIYHFEKYLEPELKKRCKRWCESFNYANNALEDVTKKKEVFVPVKEEDMIQL